MKRSYTPKDIAAKRWVTLPWGEKWSKPFGEPADNASWFISGASASGKSSFVMQLGKELCKYGLVLYLSYEEGVNQSFQRRMDYLKMDEVQGRFRVVNTSDKPLVIVEVITGCGCTTADYDPAPLTPGEERVMTWQFDSRGRFGQQFKSIEIVTAERQCATVYLDGEGYIPQK